MGNARRWRGRAKLPAVATLMAAALLGLSSSSTSTTCCSAMAASRIREPSSASGQSGGPTEEGGLSAMSPPPQRLYVRRRGDDKQQLNAEEEEDAPQHRSRRILPTASDLSLSFLQQYGLTKGPGPLSLTRDQKNVYTVTGDALLAFKTRPEGGLEQMQELRDGVVDRFGTKVEYFTGLTALTVSPDDQNVYAVGTSVMPGVGGITVLARDQAANGELSVKQQFKIDQRANVADIDGMIGANSVAVSPDGKYTYVSSGGYYRDHNLLVFTRKATDGTLGLIQNIDVYNTSASRVLPSTLVVAPDGKHVYVVGDNFAISTSVILVYAVDAATGKLTQVQEAGPFRSTLLTSAAFDPQGAFLYSTASFGNNLVWIFQREANGMLTTVIDPVDEATSGRQVGPPQGSYSSVLALDTPSLGALLLVSVEKENVVYVAQRQLSNSGRLSYFAAGVEGGEGGAALNHPASLAFKSDEKVL